MFVNIQLVLDTTIATYFWEEVNHGHLLNDQSSIKIPYGLLYREFNHTVLKKIARGTNTALMARNTIGPY